MERQKKEMTKTKAGWNERVDNKAVAVLAKSCASRKENEASSESTDFVFG